MFTLTTPYHRQANARFNLFTLLGNGAGQTPIGVNPTESELSEEQLLPEWDKKLYYLNFDIVETESLKKVSNLNDLTAQGNFFFGRIACLSEPCEIKGYLELDIESFIKTDTYIYSFEFPYTVQSVEKADSNNLIFLPGGHHNLSFSNNTVVVEGTSHCQVNEESGITLYFTTDSEDFSYQAVKVLDFANTDVDYVDAIEYQGNRYFLSSRLLTKSFLYNSKLKQALLVPPVVVPKVIEIIENPNTLSVSTWYPAGGGGGTRIMPSGLVTFAGFTGTENVNGTPFGTRTINQLVAGGSSWIPTSPVWAVATFTMTIVGAPKAYTFTIHRLPFVSVFQFATHPVFGSAFTVSRASTTGSIIGSANVYGWVTASTVGESTSNAVLELVSSTYLKMAKYPNYIPALTEVPLNDMLITNVNQGVRLVYTGPGPGYSQPTTGSVSFRIKDSVNPSLVSPTYTATINLV